MSIGSTIKQYPTAIDQFATWQDDIDNILAVIVNDVQDQVIVIETELGTDPAGSMADLKTRLAVSINDDGTLKTSGYWTQVGSDIYYTTGNVGIGTTNPQTFLNVYGGSLATRNELLRLRTPSGSLGTAGRINGYFGMIDFIQHATGRGATQFMDDTGTNVRMHIENYGGKAGRVGIGTTDPLNKLHVQGDVYVTSKIGIGTTNPLDILHVEGDATFLGSVGIGTTVPGGQLHVEGDARITGNIECTDDTSNLGSASRRFRNIYLERNILFDTQLLFADTGGTRVGDIVGKNDDTSNLGSDARRWANLYMSSTIDYSTDLDFRSSGVDYVTIKTTGEVGIGTTNPQDTLHVEGDIVGRNDDTSNLGSSTRRWDNLYMASTIDYSSDLNFDSSGTKVTFQTDGSVGIGSTQPQSLFEVSGGDIRVTSGSFIDDGTTLDVPDYVFESTYDLISLKEIKDFISKNKHLVGMPTREEIKSKGMNYGKMIMKLLEKIEELTLHIINLEEKVNK